MKRIVMLSAFIVGFILVNKDIKAQTSWELGARFGDRGSIEGTIPLGNAPRLQPAVFFYDRFGVAGYFDWMFKLKDGPTGLKFFPGVGPEFYFEHQFDLSIAGNFGVEYAFDFPLTVGFDWRPAVFLTNGIGFYGGNWGLSARFRFGEYVKFEKAN